MNEENELIKKHIKLMLNLLLIAVMILGIAHAEEHTLAQNQEDEYLLHCAVCHGTQGRGDGPMKHSLTTAPKDLTTLSKENGGSFPETMIYQIIDGRRDISSHGTREMPIWGNRFLSMDGTEIAVDARIDQILRFLESIQVE